ncbi:MAG TPA: DNA-binding domain-containing protein, partial [Polyangia bacterium]|nr:DNA-binding domain-containing protein [Polyangia bacterium]
AELQRRFFELVTGPEGVAKELATRGLPDGAVAAIIEGDARASAIERLDVYANMYFFRILDVLRSDYPKLLAVVGDDAFHDLATDYLQAHPSRHPSLRFVGAALPTFVAKHALAEERPWLGALAALEWARVDVFDRADAAPLTREALATAAPEDFATLPLVPVPASALVPVAWTVEETWRAIEDGRAPEAPATAAPGHALLIWRRDLTVHHRAVPTDERRAIELLLGRTTFGALCTALGDEADSEEDAAARAVQLLGHWLADELLAAPA